MGNIDTARILTRIGAFFIIIGGFVEIGESAVYFIFDLMFYATLSIGSLLSLVGGIVAIILGFLILFMFMKMIGENNINAGIFILIFGLIGGIFAWYIGWIGGILCLVAAILLFIEGSGQGAQCSFLPFFIYGDL